MSAFSLILLREPRSSSNTPTTGDCSCRHRCTFATLRRGAFPLRRSPLQPRTCTSSKLYNFRWLLPSTASGDLHFLRHSTTSGCHLLQEFSSEIHTGGRVVVIMQNMSARALYEPKLVTEFVGEFLAKHKSRPLSDQELIKVKRALWPYKMRLVPLSLWFSTYDLRQKYLWLETKVQYCLSDVGVSLASMDTIPYRSDLTGRAQPRDFSIQSLSLCQEN
ncbi:hypothetical protein L1887_19066 [Cichorium endivia]|nr:hypothetical protein L1887_19066 [Cichorium endivia]